MFRVQKHIKAMIHLCDHNDYNIRKSWHHLKSSQGLASFLHGHLKSS